MAPNRIKKLMGGVAVAVALTFVAAPAASADDDSKDQTSAKVYAKKKDSGWG